LLKISGKKEFAKGETHKLLEVFWYGLCFTDTSIWPRCAVFLHCFCERYPAKPLCARIVLWHFGAACGDYIRVRLGICFENKRENGLVFAWPFGIYANRLDLYGDVCRWHTVYFGKHTKLGQKGKIVRLSALLV